MNQNNPTFEQNMARLEQIVQALEQGDAPLEESMKLFTEGTGLVRTCGAMLDQAELQVKQILADPDGNPREEEFAHEALQ